MSDIDRLKEMDVEEIQKRTFIAPKIIRALLKGDFDKIGSRLKALGFVKILERELSLDLSELKEKINAYDFDTQEHPLPPIETVEEELKQEKHTIKIALFSILAVGIAFFLYKSFSKPQMSVSKPLENQKSFSEPITTKEVKSSTQQSSSTSKQEPVAIIETNVTNEENITSKENETVIAHSSEETNLSLESTHPSIVIIPRKRLWVGIVYLDNYKKRNYITSAPIEINSSRDQLIVTGYGVLDVDIDGNITSYHQRHKLRFLYKDGKFQEINVSTFKEYNRGKSW